jgi:hypothetical protein
VTLESFLANGARVAEPQMATSGVGRVIRRHTGSPGYPIRARLSPTSDGGSSLRGQRPPQRLALLRPATLSPAPRPLP